MAGLSRNEIVRADVAVCWKYDGPRPGARSRTPASTTVYKRMRGAEPVRAGNRAQSPNARSAVSPGPSLAPVPYAHSKLKLSKNTAISPVGVTVM